MGEKPVSDKPLPALVMKDLGPRQQSDTEPLDEAPSEEIVFRGTGLLRLRPLASLPRIR